jgi:predicted nucleic acid-binding protein
MARAVLDTDVVSYLFKRDTRARRYRRHLHGTEGILSFMTVAELEQWALRRRWGQRRREELAQLTERFPVHFADRLLCRLWAEVTNRARRNGRPIETADAWIAATALVLGLPLVTHNPGVFAGVDGLTVVAEGEA